MISISTSKLEHYQHEYHTWLRVIDFYKQENDHLKTRLSEALLIKSDKKFLTIAEQYHHKFVLQDVFMKVLGKNIDDVGDALNALSIPMISKEIKLDEKIDAKRKKICNKIEFFERNFTRLIKEFNEYFLTAI
jgi:hypothetical protein